MTDHIAGNPALYPATVALWEDSDPPDASHFGLGPTDLANRTANLDARLTQEVTDRTAAIHLLTQTIDVQTAVQGSAALYDTDVVSGIATSYTLVGGVSVTFTSKCNPGDIVRFGVSARCFADAGSVGSFQMRVVDGATNVDLEETLRRAPTDGSRIFYDINSAYTLAHVTAGGTVQVRMMFKRDSGSGNIHVLFPTTLTVQLIRPGS